MLRSAVLLLIAACSLPCAAQTPSTPAQAPPPLRTSAQLVVEDVVVTDSHGGPVRGLQQGDFTVLENKTPQSIKSLEEHTGLAAAGNSAPQPLAQGIFTNVPPTKSGNPVTVLLLDGLNTPPAAQPYLRDQLVKFLAERRPGTQTAVFSLVTQLGMLQDFTTDPTILQRVVKMQGVKFSPLLVTELNDKAALRTSMTLESEIEQAESNGNAGLAQTLARIQTNLQDMEAVARSQDLQNRARTTMNALNQLARYLAGVPGRKNLLWFSGSFPVYIQRDLQTTGDVFAGQANLTAELKQTISLLAQNQVAVYPIDARGLQLAPSQDIETSARGNLRQTQRAFGTTSSTPQDAQFYTDQAAEHSTMNSLAEGTGGQAYYNTNGLFQAAERAEHDANSYYTLLYTPPPGAKPGEFRQVQVQVNRPGVKLAYRRGYYTSGAAQGTTPSVSPFASAASFASPDSSEIQLLLQPSHADDSALPKPIGFAAFGAGDHATYALNLLVPATAVDFAEGADSKIHGTLEFATVVYDAKGKILDSHQDRAVVALDPARYQTLLQGGVRFHHTVTLPTKGEPFVRVLVRDVSTNKIGSLRLSAEQIRRSAVK